MFHLKKAYIFCFFVFAFLSHACWSTSSALFFIDFFPYSVFIDVINQRFMINVLRHIYVCVCVCTRFASSNWLLLLLLLWWWLVLLPFVDNLDCFDRWLLNRVLSIYTLMRFLFTLCSFAAFTLDLFSVFADLLFVVDPFAGWLAPLHSVCLFLRLLISFHSIPLAIPGPHQPIHKTFDCVRQRISAILISPVDQHMDAFGPSFHANIYRPYHFASNRNL